jgi:uncharacterized membrane protein YcaP (DUF421 family)
MLSRRASSLRPPGLQTERSQFFNRLPGGFMEAVVRGLSVYFFLLTVFRISGKQTLSQMTSFDLVLLLIISETTQQAMVDNDHSITNGFLLIVTLIGTTIVLAALKQFFPRLEVVLDGQAVIVVDKGQLVHRVMQKSRVDEEDILSAARKQQGLERLDQIKYAILERDGTISIIEKDPAKTG